MSIAELPPRAIQPPPPSASLREQSRVYLSLEHAIYLLLFAGALLAHLWGLGDRALHHDETHHAYFSWRLFTGQGYIHDPLLHGPFLYHINALMYFLFGDSDYTARLSVALFGSALVLLPFLLRREIGRGAALIASAYLAISPAFLYVGRFIRHDMFAVTFELLTFIAIVRYASTRQTRWLFVGTAALALMFTTMETFFLYVAIFAPLLILLFLWRTWKPGIALLAVFGVVLVALVFVLPGKPASQPGESGVARANGPFVCPSPGNLFPPDNPINANPGPIFGFPPLATADNNYAVCVRNAPENDFALYLAKLWMFFSNPAILLALALTVAGALAFWWLIWRRRDADGATAWQRASAEHDGTMLAFASLGRDRRVLLALILFVGLYSLFFTAFFTNPTGILSGPFGSVLYWLGQQDVKRGGQPRYYYFVLLAIYEPLVLVWSMVGLIMTGVLLIRRLTNRNADIDALETRAAGSTPIDWSLALPVMLVWWSLATVFLYSWAGEKMPWLTIHVALPLVLLGAWALNKTLRWGLGALQSYDRAPLAMFVGACGVLTVFGFVLMSVVTEQGSAGYAQSGLLALLPLAVLLVMTVCYGLLRGPRRAIGGLALAVSLIVAVGSARAAQQLSFRNGDIAREMMIYTQTSPDVARSINTLKEASLRDPQNMDMAIWYDNETVWGWYTRNFRNGVRQQPQLAAPPGDDVRAVLMLTENYDGNAQNKQFLEGFVVQRYPLRWWFAEEQHYRLPDDWRTAEVSPQSPLLMRILREPLDPLTVRQTWRYLMFREPVAPLGSSDFVLAVRPNLADAFGMGLGSTTTP